MPRKKETTATAETNRVEIKPITNENLSAKYPRPQQKQ